MLFSRISFTIDPISYSSSTYGRGRRWNTSCELKDQIYIYTNLNNLNLQACQNCLLDRTTLDNMMAIYRFHKRKHKFKQFSSIKTAVTTNLKMYKNINLTLTSKSLVGSACCYPIKHSCQPT